MRHLFFITLYLSDVLAIWFYIVLLLDESCALHSWWTAEGHVPNTAVEYTSVATWIAPSYWILGYLIILFHLTTQQYQTIWKEAFIAS